MRVPQRNRDGRADPSRSPAAQLEKFRYGLRIRSQRALDAVEGRLAASGEKAVECEIRISHPSIPCDNHLRVRYGVER